ncbi:metallophosphoesterase [Synechococcus sp. CS-602]|uniref:metallophosphoesterase n=1 Tax=Synechococcaceae TaxID=1890426 RepID=UPI0008FF3AF3|nr:MULTISPECIES: metallophosphoesterase [Synechococcaceae]MCT4363651.1 metallophosphoesterase [Candidatus Regnicoccus frigidus MAG-AL1]APD47315.1 serine/threonine protein phosphatase [Synechococcus sp. SynAce01]MCT0202787.1 metallophosphoesterase [Synechococcus sp. CS-603]MCT0203700.1 metallophosphoesterase [Synechococcus sp. CS-602]MCT0245303.1 metallophosphoesterase [Synechococcus sp. CS-601]
MAFPTQRLHHWVIGDVHGCARSLQALIARLPIQDRIILCGDLINRGPEIERSMQLGWNLVCSGRAVWLRGNHEQRLLCALERGGGLANSELAGSDTFRQLGNRQCALWSSRLTSLPRAYWGDGWVATHAGFDPLTWAPDLGIRSRFWEAYDGRYGTVIIGHTPQQEVKRLQNAIVMVDTGACYGGRLTAYCPETGASLSVPGSEQVERNELAAFDPNADRRGRLLTSGRC